MADSLSAACDSDARRFKVTGDVHLLLLDDNQVLFGRRQDTGFEDGSYHVPSGHLEAGESVIDALIREAKEEVGVTIAPEAVEFVHVMHDSSSGGRVALHRAPVGWSTREPGTGQMQRTTLVPAECTTRPNDRLLSRSA
jgi:8-oxo-dGTP pyrophosphatase MutT (NUDIX family)